MLQQTYGRLSGLNCTAPLVICGEDHRFTVAEQMRQSGMDEQQIILEPAGRNTAPAVALAALHATKAGEDPLLLVLAADHAILDEQAFQQSVLLAQQAAQQDKLVTFGILPTAAETGYGYVKQGRELDSLGGIFQVAEFVEKPDRETAERYVGSGDYLWNSGMFLFKASRYLQELKQHRPDIYQACAQAYAKASQDQDFFRPDRDSFLGCPDDSIDYAVMENTADAAVVPLDCGWSDVGSWSALWEVLDKDSQGNSVRGDVLLHNTRDSYLHSEGKLVSAVGVDNIVVVQTEDAVLVAAKDAVQDVKHIVSQLKQRGRTEAETHRKVYRPWGYYDSIDAGERFQVKHIVVNPGAKLSLQMHHHRAEHWIVVSGTAEVTRGDEVFLVAENHSTYIPLGVTHRLYNPGNIPLEMIEVQSGSYLGEDDIIRFEDSYNRC